MADPNILVPDDEGVMHRAQLVALAEGDIVFPENDKSTNVQVMGGDGVLHRAQLVAMIGGGGGGDAHNKGWYATPTALREAIPTGEDGDYAFVGSTDTLWLWDSDTTDWVDTDQKGQVESVNGQTGAVQIKSINGNSLMGSGDLEILPYLSYPADWPTTSATTTKQFCDAIAADTTAVAGKMYLGEVRLSDLPGSMVNAEIVVEIMDGTTSSNKVILLTCTSGNTSPYMWKYTYWNGGSSVSGWIGFQPELPSQSGNSGKFLTTDGSAISWGDALKNTATGTDSLSILGTPVTANYSVAIGASSKASSNSSLGIGVSARADSSYATAVGASTYATNYATAVGNSADARNNALALGHDAKANQNTIQLVCGDYGRTNSDANTLKVGNNNGNYEMMSADGTIPTDRFTSTPVADGTYVPTLSISSGTATRSWSAPADPLPSQTGNSGKLLTTNGTTASWSSTSDLGLSGVTFRMWGANE